MSRREHRKEGEPMSNTERDARSVVITKTGTFDSVDAAADRLIALVEARGLSLFAVIDHSGEAKRHGLNLRDTKVVIFGSPVAGTPVMQAAPLSALDLPLKVLVWDDEGSIRISYTDPGALADRYHLSQELAGRLAGIEDLTDLLVA